MKKVTSLSQILKKLNEGLPPGTWVEVPGVYISTEGGIEGDRVVPKDSSLVLKYVVNMQTSELRSYISKLLDDVTETKDLP